MVLCCKVGCIRVSELISKLFGPLVRREFGRPRQAGAFWIGMVGWAGREARGDAQALAQGCSERF
eukprot:scaffold1642_cov252-Pinguiococcus_pyrenoidosus.AAC.38